MSVLRSVRGALTRVASLFGGRRPEADEDLREELQAHLEMATSENIRRGMHPDAARRAALLASGGRTVAAEAVSAQRGLPWVESVLADINYSVRTLRHWQWAVGHQGALRTTSVVLPRQISPA